MKVTANHWSAETGQHIDGWVFDKFNDEYGTTDGKYLFLWVRRQYAGRWIWKMVSDDPRGAGELTGAAGCAWEAMQAGLREMARFPKRRRK
jgi:hypothetical protein